MMKHLLLSLLMITGMQASAQSDFDRSIDKENGSVVFKGQISFEDLKGETSFGWMARGAESYQPDSATLVFLKSNLPQYQLVVLMGTWCDDSQDLIPKLYKTLDLAAYPMSGLSMYGVDRAKEAKYIEHKLYKVEKVPTIILYRNNMEVGRIVETVKKRIEKDLAQLIEEDIASEKSE